MAEPPRANACCERRMEASGPHKSLPYCEKVKSLILGARTSRESAEPLMQQLQAVPQPLNANKQRAINFSSLRHHRGLWGQRETVYSMIESCKNQLTHNLALNSWFGWDAYKECAASRALLRHLYKSKGNEGDFLSANRHRTWKRCVKQ